MTQQLPSSRRGSHMFRNESQISRVTYRCPVFILLSRALAHTLKKAENHGTGCPHYILDFTEGFISSLLPGEGRTPCVDPYRVLVPAHRFRWANSLLLLLGLSDDFMTIWWLDKANRVLFADSFNDCLPWPRLGQVNSGAGNSSGMLYLSDRADPSPLSRKICVLRKLVWGAGSGHPTQVLSGCLNWYFNYCATYQFCLLPYKYF